MSACRSKLYIKSYGFDFWSTLRFGDDAPYVASFLFTYRPEVLL